MPAIALNWGRGSAVDLAVLVGRIKGVAFRELLVWEEEVFGRGALLAACDRLAPHVRAQVDPAREALGVDGSRWYSARLVHAIIDALFADVDPAERSARARAAGARILERTARGPLMTLFQLIATPDRCAKHAQRMWEAYYETGLSTVARIAPNAYDQRVEAWSEHHPVICEMHLGAAEALYRAMGCKDARAERTGCVSLGMPACTSQIRWAA